jgi:hypothetical protein
MGAGANPTEANPGDDGLTETVVVRVSQAMLAMIDVYAIREERSRAAFIRRAIAADIGSRDIGDLIEASSLGTPAAKALRESVPIEQAQEVVRRANQLRAAQRAPSRTATTCTFKPQARNALRCDTCGGKRGDHR